MLEIRLLLTVLAVLCTFSFPIVSSGQHIWKKRISLLLKRGLNIPSNLSFAHHMRGIFKTASRGKCGKKRRSRRQDVVKKWKVKAATEKPMKLVQALEN